MLLELSVDSILTLIQNQPVAQYVRTAVWAYPVLEMFHLVGLGLLIGPIVIYDLRILAGWGNIDTPSAGRLLLPWVWTGFVINALSGLLLFSSDAFEFAGNPAFQAKMALLALAGLNAMVFQLRSDPTQLAGPVAAVSYRAQAAISLTIWLAVIVAGRMMAYAA